jgi:anaphase-promoting complex subunit 1
LKKPASATFIAHDIEQNEIIWFNAADEGFIIGWKFIFELERAITQDHYRYQAVSAVAVHATRQKQKDVLVVQSTGSLLLWIGVMKCIPCKFPFLSQKRHHLDTVETASKRRRMGTTTEHSLNHQVDEHPSQPSSLDDITSQSPVEIRRATYNRITIKMSNHLVYLSVLNFFVRSSLLQDCLSALQMSIPRRLYELFIVRFIDFHFGQDHGHHLHEWESFIVIFMSFCYGKQVGNRRHAPSVGRSKWDYLETLPLHPSLISFSSLQTLALNQTTTESIEQKLSLEAEKIAKKHSNDPTILEYLPAVLLSFHLIYEDMKLSTQNLRRQSNLAGLLLQIARKIMWSSFEQYYMHDGHSADRRIILPGISTSVICIFGAFALMDGYLGTTSFYLNLHEEFTYDHQPPNIMRWIRDRFRLRTPETFPDIANIPSYFNIPLTYKLAEVECCKLLQKIVSVVNILVDSESVGHRRAVERMCSQKLNLQDIDCLPFGVSVPIREALKLCRTYPPESLDIAGYILIGTIWNIVSWLHSTYVPYCKQDVKILQSK